MMAAILGLGVLASACATTVEEDTEPTITVSEGLQPADESANQLDSEVIVDDAAPPTTLAIDGTALDLLPDLGVEMSRLSAAIIDGNGSETLAVINATWTTIRDEIATSRPELVDSMQVTIDMANTAVETRRPADGDKAFSLMNDLIDAFVGDG